MKGVKGMETKQYKELEIILSGFECDKNCPYCTAKITRWDEEEDDLHLLALNAGIMKELGYKFHYVTIGGNGEPTMHSYQKLKEIVEIFDGWDVPVKRVLTSGNIFRPENRDKYNLFVSHGWMFEVTVVAFLWEKNEKIQGYHFNYFNTDAFKNSRIRLNYVLLKDNIMNMPEELKLYAFIYPNIETLAVKLLNVNTMDEQSRSHPYSQWIIKNGIPKEDRDKVAGILNDNFEYVGKTYDTCSWKMDVYGKSFEIYFSWKKMPYGFSDLVWYGNRFVTYQLEAVHIPLLPKVYVASRFIKETLENGQISFAGDFRSQLIGIEEDFINFNAHSFIRNEDGEAVAQYLGPFWNEKASDGTLTSDACNQVVSTENMLIEKCDIFVAYFDEILSPGGITEMMYALYLKKRIIIFFKTEEDIRYSMKSSAWYPITFAMQIDNSINPIPVIDSYEVKSKIADVI